MNYHHFIQVNAALEVQFNISDQNLHCKQFFNLKMTRTAPCKECKELVGQFQKKLFSIVTEINFKYLQAIAFYLFNGPMKGWYVSMLHSKKEND